MRWSLARSPARSLGEWWVGSLRRPALCCAALCCALFAAQPPTHIIIIIIIIFRYRSYKVMPYSTACNTPLSNFEAGLDYRNVSDPAVTVAFPLEDEPDTSLLAWTTTPWTLPSNLALCVNSKMDYVKIKDAATGKVYILAEARLVELCVFVASLCF